MTTTLNATTSNGLVVTPDNSGSTAIQGNGTTGVNVNSSGQVTMPSQPGFFIGSYSPSAVGANYFKIASPTTFWSVGTGLNLTGGTSGGTRYTAPVSGYYLFQWSLMGSGSTGRLIAFTEKNGSVVTESDIDGLNYACANTNFVINLNAGDYLEFRTSGSYYGGNAAHYMTIRLLG